MSPHGGYTTSGVVQGSIPCMGATGQASGIDGRGCTVNPVHGHPVWQHEPVRFQGHIQYGTCKVGVAVYRQSDGARIDFVDMPVGDSMGNYMLEAGWAQFPAGDVPFHATLSPQWHKLHDATRWAASSGKFANGLAERLYGEALEGFSDREISDVDRLGHYSAHLEDCAIVHTNGQGFVDVTVYGDSIALLNQWELIVEDYERLDVQTAQEVLPLGECDGIFLIFDTAKHIGNLPDFDEIMEHVAECEKCGAVGWPQS